MDVPQFTKNPLLQPLSLSGPLDPVPWDAPVPVVFRLVRALLLVVLRPRLPVLPVADDDRALALERMFARLVVRVAVPLLGDGVVPDVMLSVHSPI